MRVDTCKGKRRWIEMGAREGLDVTGKGLLAFQTPRVVHDQGYGGDFQQGIGLWIESCCFHVDDDREVTAKTLSDRESGLRAHGDRIRDLQSFSDGVSVDFPVVWE